VDGQQNTADPMHGRDAAGTDPSNSLEGASHAAAGDSAEDAGHSSEVAAEAAADAAGADDVVAPAGADSGEEDTLAASAAAGDESSGEGIAPPAGESGDVTPGAGERPDRPRKPRREKPRRDPHEPTFGGVFLDTLQRLAGLRGQFAYGVPARLWRANREQTIRILREEVPMPTFKNQIHCILNSDPEWLAHDVHFEMLSSVTPPEDSFRWLWLYMMLR
jgi:hypothetical protein